MKALVIYDTNFGHTKMIAETIAKGLGKNAKAVLVSGFDLKELKGIELLVAGSYIWTAVAGIIVRLVVFCLPDKDLKEIEKL